MWRFLWGAIATVKYKLGKILNILVYSMMKLSGIRIIIQKINYPILWDGQDTHPYIISRLFGLHHKKFRDIFYLEVSYKNLCLLADAIKFGTILEYRTCFYLYYSTLWCSS
ncbi:MAG: hypothetical protein AN485_10245 [Anabaena sp. MDT14b]|nr:MAG: hypothetical protein AN485_10245 [Anabaena sp. MDT14b]